MKSTMRHTNGKMPSVGLDLTKLIELRSLASSRVTALTASANEIGTQIQFVDLLLQRHLGGASIDSHLALVGAGRRLAEMLDCEVRS